MSIIEKFSIGYRLKHDNAEHEVEKEISKNNKMSKNIRTKTFTRKGTVSADLAKQLVTLGYNIDNIMCLVKNHPFVSVEEAINLIEKNPESGLYNHYFIPKENFNREIPKNNNGSENIKTKEEEEVCRICGGKKKEHIDEKDEFQKLVIESKKKI